MLSGYRRIPRTLVTFLAVSLTALGDTTSIDNGLVRVNLSLSPSTQHWVLFVAVPEGDNWRDVIRLGVGGKIQDAEKASEYRTRLGTYYPLQKAMPESIRRTVTPAGATLTFRLAREDVWLDLRLHVRQGLPFIFVESPAVSVPELVPETAVQFLGPVEFLVHDDAGEPLRRRILEARNYREQGLWPRNRQYLAVGGAEMPATMMILWLPASGMHRTQWGRGGLRNALPHTPYVLAVDTATFERDPHTVQHRAVGWVSRLRKTLTDHPFEPGDNAP